MFVIDIFHYFHHPLSLPLSIHFPFSASTNEGGRLGDSSFGLGTALSHSLASAPLLLLQESAKIISETKMPPKIGWGGWGVC